jgi:uncharacterized protein
MLKRRTVCMAGAVTFLVAGLAAPWNVSQAQEAVRIGSSSVGSIFYTIAVAASELVQKHAGIATNAESVGGSTASINGIGAGKTEFALANAFASTAGYTGTYMFTDKPVNVRLVLQGQPSYRAMVARKDSGIKTPKDLEGKIVIAQRRSLPELELTMNAMGQVFGLDMSKIKVVATTNTGEVVKALRAGTVDAAIMPFSRKAPQIEEPMHDQIVDFVYISEADRDAMLKLLPKAMHAGLIEKGLFSNQGQDLYTFELNSYFVARGDLSDDLVYKVAKAILDNHEEFVSYHAAAASWTAEASLRNPAIPFHDGAIRYYKEKGMWTDELQSRQEELLKQAGG